MRNNQINEQPRRQFLSWLANVPLAAAAVSCAGPRNFLREPPEPLSPKEIALQKLIAEEFELNQDGYENFHGIHGAESPKSILTSFQIDDNVYGAIGRDSHKKGLEILTFENDGLRVRKVSKEFGIYFRRAQNEPALFRQESEVLYDSRGRISHLEVGQALIEHFGGKAYERGSPASVTIAYTEDGAQVHAQGYICPWNKDINVRPNYRFEDHDGPMIAVESIPFGGFSTSRSRTDEVIFDGAGVFTGHKTYNSGRREIASSIIIAGEDGHRIQERTFRGDKNTTYWDTTGGKTAFGSDHVWERDDDGNVLVYKVLNQRGDWSEFNGAEITYDSEGIPRHIDFSQEDMRHGDGHHHAYFHDKHGFDITVRNNRPVLTRTHFSYEKPKS